MVTLHRYTDSELSKICSEGVSKQSMRTDASGVTLVIYPLKDGGASIVFVFRFLLNGKRIKKTIGRFPEVSISEARTQWALLKDKADKGLLCEPEQIKRISAFDDFSFGSVWQEWRKIQNPSLAENTVFKYESCWRAHLHLLENVSVKDFTPRFILNFFEPYIQRGELITVNKMARMISSCLDYAVFLQLLEINPLIGITKYLPKVKLGHLATFNDETLEEDMRELFKKFSDASKNVQVLLYMYFFTLLRSVELRRLKVDDIQGNIATVKTKTLSEFKVPLSTQAMRCVEYMKSLKSQYQNPYLFEGMAEDGIISENTLNKELTNRGYKDKLRVHGIRACGRQWLQTLPDAKESIIEQCLSHVVGSRTEQAYNRGQYVQERAKLMQEWSNFVEKCIGNHGDFVFK